MFNVFFTSWPPIIMGLFDRPLDAEHMMKFPSLYENFQDHFSLKVSYELNTEFYCHNLTTIK